MRAVDRFYELFVYHYGFKKIAGYLLRQPLIYKNPIYNLFYRQNQQKQMEQYCQKPRRIMIENTNLCQAGCVFCPHRHMKRKTGIMDMKLFQKIIDQCRQFAVDYVTIYGFGEPLLDPDFVKKVKITKKAGIKRVTTNTNAHFLTPNIARHLVKLGLDEIYISFDAATVRTYKQIRPNLDFKQVEANIRQLIKYRKQTNRSKPQIILSYVITDTNKNEVAKYSQKWRSQVDYISFSALHNWTGDIRMAKPPGLKEPCRLLWTDMVISWDGKVPLCCNDYENKVVLGDISTSSIPEIWGGKKLRTIRSWHRHNQFGKIPICQNCYYNYHHKSPWWVSK